MAKNLKLSFFLSPVQAGFPSPADDYVEESLDLNELLITHPAATFFVRVEGESMRESNIFPGDILIVDRSLTPKNKKIIVAILDGEFTLKRLSLEGGKVTLLPENPAFPPIPITEEMDFEIWGVVSYVIHPAR